MDETRPTTGPVSLPANPKQVAESRVSELSSLGNLHRPPTPREYEHAALDIALDDRSDEEVYAVLQHLHSEAVAALAGAAHWLESAADRVISARVADR